MKPVGLLGKGYLGKAILSHPDFGSDGWHTSRKASPYPVEGLHRYDWSSPEGIDNLPKRESVLILTIPPFHKNPEKEVARLEEWAVNLLEKRPLFRKLIYISSTSVYPELPDAQEETPEPAPNDPKGKLRLATERTLAGFFDLRVLRPGGIYGPFRNLPRNIREGKFSFVAADSAAHRIHVADLANLVMACVQNWDAFPPVCNAVDNCLAPYSKIAEWLGKSDLFDCADGLGEFRRHLSGLPQRTIRRKISNRLLKNLPYFSLLYKDFQAGFLASRLSELTFPDP